MAGDPNPAGTTGSQLEDLTVGALVHGLSAGGPVTVVATKWHGSVALTLTCRDATGHVSERVLYRDDEYALRVESSTRGWFFGDGDLFHLAAEARRIQLAHLFDPMLAISLWDAFARYLYLPRLRDQSVLFTSVGGGAATVSWDAEGFATADARDEASGRYLGLSVGGLTSPTAATLIVCPPVAVAQLNADTAEREGKTPHPDVVTPPEGRDRQRGRSRRAAAGWLDEANEIPRCGQPRPRTTRS